MANMSLHQCYREIIAASKDYRPNAQIQYAASYARTGLQFEDRTEPGPMPDEVRTQAVYVRANLGYWRTEVGIRVRQDLDRILAKVK